MTCEQFADSVELYALGVLEIGEANAMTEHLATGCTVCQRTLQGALDQNLLVSKTLPLTEPPARLRSRIKQSIAPSAAPAFTWLPWAVAIAALLALAIGWTSQTRLRITEPKIAESQTAEQSKLSKMLQILGAPGTKAVAFTDTKVRSLQGAVYIHQKLGLALVVDRLPNAPPGWKYESWLVPKAGAPHPVEPFHPDADGRAVSIVPGPVEVEHLAAIAVSMEPQDSHPTTPTTLVFKAGI